MKELRAESNALKEVLGELYHCEGLLGLGIDSLKAQALTAVLDDYSGFIITLHLCTSMSATDVADSLDEVKVQHRPRLLSDNGP